MTHPIKKAPNRAATGSEGEDKTTPKHSTAPAKHQGRSTRWKDLERTAAAKLKGRRIVRGDFFERSPDVRVDAFAAILDELREARRCHS